MAPRSPRPGLHDGGQGYDGDHLVSGDRCTSDGAKSWFSCQDAYGFVPPTGPMLRINASGPTGPTSPWPFAPSWRQPVCFVSGSLYEIY